MGLPALLPGCAPPAQTFHSVKRLIGRRFGDVSALAELLPFQVAAGEDGRVVVGCQSAPSMAPEEVLL